MLSGEMCFFFFVCLFYLMEFHLPKRLKKAAISCEWMTNVGALDLVILLLHKSVGRWLGRFFPKHGVLTALLSTSPLRSGTERGSGLGFIQTVS